MAATKITVKLLIDKEKNRVVLAESEKDFVDVLFSFLTLPMGTIIRLLGKQSNLGCLDKLYESVQNLDTKYLQTEACRTMLLRPISSAEDLCENLTIQVDDAHPRRGFHCVNRFRGCLWWSRVKNTGCQCGNLMDIEFALKKTELESNGLFVKKDVMFMISDDLRIMPLTMEAGKFMLNRLGAGRGTVFYEQIVEVGRDEVLNLLKCSLQSSTSLTDVFIGRSDDLNHVVKLEFEDKVQAHNKQEEEMEPGTISVNLFLNVPEKKVLFGEAGYEFVDLLFSLLILPLGSIVKYFSGKSSMGSIDNLYKSVEDLKVSECMTSGDRKVMLLSPKLTPYSGCDNQLIQTTEMLPTDLTVIRCTNCCKFCLDNFNLCCGYNYAVKVVVGSTNPKSRVPAKKSGGGYVTGTVKYMVTDEMVVKPLSFISIMDTAHQLKKTMFEVEEKTVFIGEAEVMALLRATLTTKSALSSAFSPKKKKRYRHLGGF